MTLNGITSISWLMTEALGFKHDLLLQARFKYSLYTTLLVFQVMASVDVNSNPLAQIR